MWKKQAEHADTHAHPCNFVSCVSEIDTFCSLRFCQKFINQANADVVTPAMTFLRKGGSVNMNSDPRHSSSVCCDRYMHVIMPTQLPNSHCVELFVDLLNILKVCDQLPDDGPIGQGEYLRVLQRSHASSTLRKLFVHST